MTEYIAAALTDIGNARKVNQDSICVKIADTDNYGQVVMAVVCDGMGGLSKGEVASATVIRKFSQWYESELPYLIKDHDMSELSCEWQKIIDSQNQLIAKYGETSGIKLGTTFSGMLIINNEYMIVHVGDSRIYRINEEVKWKTSDHTLAARELANGNISEEEAKFDKRRHVLLQCVGASSKIKADIVFGRIHSNDIFLLCSDGLYNTIDENEIAEKLKCKKTDSVGDLRTTCSDLIEKAKNNGERDNITVALIKCKDA